MELEAIVAVFSDWGIGCEGTQQLVLKADRAHFRELTRGAAVIVGRRTLADLPGGKPLQGRANIVITRQESPIEGAELAHSPGEAVALAQKYGRCLVIGGASIYDALLPDICRVYVTRIERAPVSDRYFADLDASDEWHCVSDSGAMNEDGIEYRFLTYERV